MHTVAFISTEFGDDLILSFAISDGQDPMSITSLTLIRTPKFEPLLPVEDRGVNISLEGRTEDMNDFVQHVVYSKNERTVSIKTQLHAYELDLTRVDEEELLDMQKLFQRLNHDGNFLRLKALIVFDTRCNICSGSMDNADRTVAHCPSLCDKLRE